MTASGMGLLRIARTLAAEGVRSPSGAGWGTTSLAWVLNRELYRGQVIYGKTEKPQRGAKKKVKRPASEWVVREQPELRIISEELWHAAHARIARTRQTHRGHRKANGALHGR